MSYKMDKPHEPKERNLVRGAIRRVFSRSKLRQQALDRHAIAHSDPLRPKVTRWAWCAICGIIEARYLFQVDHVVPVVALHERLEDMSWDQFIDRMWCDASNLQACCLDCHKRKSKDETKERRRLKKERGLK